MKTCKSCQWWDYWGGVLMTDDEPRHLGYCEPSGTQVQWKGLVASDYTCGEWDEKSDA